MKLPPIPDVVGAVLGPIPVTLCETIENDGVECNGLWLPDERAIQIRSGLSLTERWWTLHHEVTHAILHDLGVSLPDEDEEHVCNALATARLLEMQGRAWTPRKRPPRRSS